MVNSREIASNRIAWIDRTKGIGIIFVVLGHLSDQWASFVYVFHMPLFFILSGYLLNDRIDFSTLMHRKIRSLAIPYLGFLLVFNIRTCIALLLQLSHGISAVNWEFFRNYFENQIWGGTALTNNQVVFWFPPVLFFSQLVYHKLKASLPKMTFSAVVAASYALALGNQIIFPTIQFPLALNIVLAALPLLYLGGCLKQQMIGSTQRILAGVCFLGTILMIVVFKFHLGMNMRSANFGPPVIGYISALGGTLCCFWLAQKMDDARLPSRILASVGASSMTIMYLHCSFINSLPQSHRSDWLLAPLILIICWAIHWLLSRNALGATIFVGSTSLARNPSAQSPTPAFLP